MKTLRETLAAGGLDQDDTITHGPGQMYVLAKRMVAGDLTRQEWGDINGATRAMIGGMVTALVIGDDSGDQFDRLRAMVFVVQPGSRA